MNCIDDFYDFYYFNGLSNERIDK